jgi:hypothetical protein
MVSSVMVVMMIWIGGHSGGPTTIQGFETIRACEAAALVMRANQPTRMHDSYVRHACMELPIR